MAAVLSAGLLWLQASPSEAACPLDVPGEPRVLVLALDGVSLRLIERARAAGEFADWPPPVELISTFPSMSNVAFTAMLEEFGAEPIAGYEMRHFSLEDNTIYPGSDPSGYAWKKMFQVVTDTFGAKTSLYMTPAKRARGVLAELQDVVLDSPQPRVVFAHMAPTDVLSHIRGDEATYKVVLAVAALLRRLMPEHEERFGRPLEVVLLSDHGNGAEKVRYTDGLRDALRQEGFRFGKRLDGSRRIVAPTYGAVNYGPLYLDPALAAEAATAAVRHESVDLAAWMSGERRVTVISPRGRATIGWQALGGERTFSYDVDSGDPLGLLDARSTLARRGDLDAAGFGGEAAWFSAGSRGRYPDALPRLVDSLTTRYVENPATVVLSLGPGWAWGQGSVRFGASIQGGRLEGTHGGLDRESSLGFLLASNRQRQPKGVVSAQQALSPWLDLRDCVDDKAQ